MNGRWSFVRKIAVWMCLPGCITLGLTVPGHAATAPSTSPSPSPSPKVIGSVVARERRPFNTTPAAIKTFPREAYRDQGQPQISSVLSQTPGAGILRGALVRGGFPWETATLIDGNSVVLPSTGSFPAGYVPSFVLQEVEIVKGFGSAEVTMPGAIGGAVNLRTADPGVVRKGMFETEGDSRGGSFTDFAYGGTEPGGRFAFTTMLSANGEPALAPQISAIGGLFERAQLAKTRYQLSPAIAGAFTYFGSQGDTGVPGTHAFETHALALYSVELHADAHADHLTGRAYDLHVQRTGTYDAFAFPGVFGGIDALDEVRGVSLQDDRQIGGNDYEVDISRRAGSAQAPGFIPTGAYDNDTMLRGSAILNPDRRTQIELSAAQLWVQEPVRAFEVPVAHAGVSVQLRKNITLRAAAGSGAAAEPLAIQYAQAASAASVETGFGYDAGVEYRLHGDTTTLSADVFQTTLHGGWIAPASANRDGAEIALQQFKRVGLGFIIQGAMLHQAPAPVAYTPPLLVPYAQAYAELSYKWPRGSRASIGALYEGANNPYERPAFAQLNANLELSLNDYSKLQFSIENLTNAYGGALPLFRYPLEASVLPGRTVRFMFRQSVGGSIYEH